MQRCVECGTVCGDVLCANCMGDEDEAMRSQGHWTTCDLCDQFPAATHPDHCTSYWQPL